ncbi:MAG TPA: acetyl-CoA carboxylase biotin carboxyl carrier protein [Blastocatellia bacterium]|nr:acetyl-CoA carboxylase biotin carboxyl carrier protein [Blastocatellia bacterium]
MNLKEIKDLIELVSDKGFAEFEIERQGFRLRISRFKESPPQVTQLSPAPVIISSALPATPEIRASVGQRALIEAEAATAAASRTTGSEPAGDAGAVEAEPDLHVIKSPIVGTFYRAPSPNSEPFVTIGAQIEPDTVVCIIEAMKLMNEIQAEVGGEIVKVYAENGQPVEYGQPLFGVRT